MRRPEPATALSWQEQPASAVRIDNGVGTVRMDNSHLLLPRIGRVRMKEELRWPGKAIRECRIREHGGRWYASVRVEIAEEEYPQHCGDGVLGY